MDKQINFKAQQPAQEEPTIVELIEAHVASCSGMSIASQMRRTAAYSKIMARGKEAVPFVMAYLFEHEEQCGMNVIILLMDLTNARPYEAQPVLAKRTSTGFVAWDIPKARAAWLEWGAANGYLRAEDFNQRRLKGRRHVDTEHSSMATEAPQRTTFARRFPILITVWNYRKYLSGFTIPLCLLFLFLFIASLVVPHGWPRLGILTIYLLCLVLFIKLFKRFS